MIEYTKPLSQEKIDKLFLHVLDVNASYYSSLTKQMEKVEIDDYYTKHILVTCTHNLALAIYPLLFYIRPKGMSKKDHKDWLAHLKEIINKSNELVPDIKDKLNAMLEDLTKD